VSVDEEEEEEEDDDDAMDEDIPRRATSFIEDEADDSDDSDHSGQDGDELDARMADDPFIDDDYRPASPPVMPFPDADPDPWLPEWLQSTVNRIEANGSTAVDDMWITEYCK